MGTSDAGAAVTSSCNVSQVVAATHGRPTRLSDEKLVLNLMSAQAAVDNQRMERLIDDDECADGSDLEVSETFSLSAASAKAPELRPVWFSIGDLNSEQRSRVWYRRMGMPSLKTLQRATKEGTMKGLQVSSRLAVDDDPVAVQANFKSAKYKGGETDTSQLPPLHTVSLDEVSGFPCKTIGDAKSAFICVCHKTNFVHVFLVQQREDFPDVLAALITDVESRGDYTLKRVWADGAFEIQAGRAKQIANDNGIKIEPTGVYCPQAGGKHESAVQRVCTRMCAMMLLAPWMPMNTWGLAMLYAAHVLNLTATQLHGTLVTPMERLTGRTPDLRNRCVHVWGCKLSYGLTKPQRMAAAGKKTSARTREFQFAGVIGNVVLMRDPETGKIYQGNRQKCHFYEGIFAMRNPPKQLNPLALIEDERNEYVKTLQTHGLMPKDGSDVGSDDEDLEVVRSIQNLKSVSEVYDAIRARFRSLESGGEKVFDPEECDVEENVLDDTQVVSTKVHNADEALSEASVDAESGTATDTVPMADDDTEEPIAKRVRFSGSEVRVEAGKRVRFSGSEASAEAAVETSEAEVRQKLGEYKGRVLQHPSDGSTATVVGAKRRKRKGADVQDWWLKLRWDCGFEKFYREDALRQLEVKDTTTEPDAKDATEERDVQGTTQEDKDATTTELRGRLRQVSSNPRRVRLNRACKERVDLVKKVAKLQHTLMVALVDDTELTDSDEDEDCDDTRTVFAAVGERLRKTFPHPNKDWPDPKNAYECFESADWRGWVWAAQMERKSWIEKSVFKVIKKSARERGRNTYPLNDLWKRKWHAADGTFDKHKCRLVVLGNLFKRGKDCSRNTWAPTASATAVRVFLYASVQAGYPIWKFDIMTAFLLALVDAKYYCFFPALFRMAEMTEDELQEARRIVVSGTAEEKRKLKRQLCGKYCDEDDRVLEILRSVYGSPSAPRSFYLHFKEILKSMGWAPTQSEPCLFQKRKGKHTMRLIIHVDDSAVSGPREMLEEFFDELSHKVKITMCKEPRDFTGIGLKYDVKEGIMKLHLQTNIEDTMRRFKDYVPKRMFPTKTPLPTGTVLSPATDAEFEEAKHLPYQELVGCLVWITVQVKIQAATAVSMLGSHAAKWSLTHFNCALKVLLWMYAGRGEGLTIRRDANFNPHDCLTAFADADLAGDIETRRSRSGMAIMMGCDTSATCISHRSALQKTIALSTTAAEILSLIEAATPIEGLRFLLAEMGMTQTAPTVVYEDNQPCIAVTADEAKPMGEHTKFYDMRVKKLKEMQFLGLIRVVYCRTACMLADMFTKNVNAVVFERLSRILTGAGGTFQELRRSLGY